MVPTAKHDHLFTLNEVEHRVRKSSSQHAPHLRIDWRPQLRVTLKARNQLRNTLGKLVTEAYAPTFVPLSDLGEITLCRCSEIDFVLLQRPRVFFTSGQPTTSFGKA